MKKNAAANFLYTIPGTSFKKKTDVGLKLKILN